MKIAMLLLIAILACSETEIRPILELPEQPVPIVTFGDGVGWGHSSTGERTLVRHVSYYLMSDIPCPRLPISW